MLGAEEGSRGHRARTVSIPTSPVLTFMLCRAGRDLGTDSLWPQFPWTHGCCLMLGSALGGSSSVLGEGMSRAGFGGCFSPRALPMGLGVLQSSFPLFLPPSMAAAALEPSALHLFTWLPRFMVVYVIT